MTTDLKTLLARFEALAADHGGEDVRHTVTVDGGQHAQHVVFGMMVHGDEVGSLPAGLAVLQDLVDGTLSYGGRVTFFVGNAEAGLAGKRFLEQDLNRVFLPREDDAHEIRRARALMPVLDQADLFLDFHQTILATEQPFWICPWTHAAAGWARALQGAEVWVTRSPGLPFSAGTCCADEYVRRREKPALTLELGEKGFSEAAATRAEAVMRRALALVDAIAEGRTTLKQAGAELAPPAAMQTVHRESFADASYQLAPGWTNFRAVAEGERVSADGAPELLAPRAGHVLFPKYPPTDATGAYVGPLPGEIYRIVAPVEGDPEVLWGMDEGAGVPLP